MFNHTALTDDQFLAVAHRVPAHQTIADVLAWTHALQPAGRLCAVVPMDEFTHDIVFAWHDGLYLSYDTT